MTIRPLRHLCEIATALSAAVSCVNRANPLNEVAPVDSGRSPAASELSPRSATRNANSTSNEVAGNRNVKSAKEGGMLAQAIHSPEDRRILLQLARDALTLAVKAGEQLTPPTTLSPHLFVQSGNFVTLTKLGQLRGCIGNIYPDAPLATAVATNAYRAALNDSRFSPVTQDELAMIAVEISVLSAPQPLLFDSAEDLLRKLQPHVDGVVFRRGTRRSTFLPQVWDKLPSPVDFLDQLTAKAGVPRDAWRQTGTEILIYHVEAFDEAEGAAHNN